MGFVKVGPTNSNSSNARIPAVENGNANFRQGQTDSLPALSETLMVGPTCLESHTFGDMMMKEIGTFEDFLSAVTTRIPRVEFHINISNASLMCIG